MGRFPVMKCQNKKCRHKWQARKKPEAIHWCPKCLHTDFVVLVPGIPRSNKKVAAVQPEVLVADSVVVVPAQAVQQVPVTKRKKWNPFALW